MPQPWECNRVMSIVPQDRGKNLCPVKETITTYLFIAPNPHYSDHPSVYYDRDLYITPISIRVYMGRSKQASVIYASIWAHGEGGIIRTSGQGKAGGGGYDKESAAISAAFDNAGIKMRADFGGCGESATRIAIASLARKLGWNTGQIIKT